MADLGRPTLFTADIATEICDRLASGESLRSICRTVDFPSEVTVRRWAMSDVEGFSAQYARAREMQAETFADDLVDIADDGSNDWMERANKKGEIEIVLDREHVARSDLRVKTRQWITSRILPKKYGDRVTQEHTGAEGGPIHIATTIDRPPSETREQWIARRQRELDQTRLLMVAPAGSAD